LEEPPGLQLSKIIHATENPGIADHPKLSAVSQLIVPEGLSTRKYERLPSCDSSGKSSSE
jgi:hypothetical protein